MKKQTDSFDWQISQARRRVRGAVYWPYVLIGFVLIAGTAFLTIPYPNILPSSDPSATSTPEPLKGARVEIKRAHLIEAGTEVEREIVIRNTDVATGTLYLKIDGYILLKNLKLFVKSESSETLIPWERRRSAEVGLFPPDEQRAYRLITYRHAPSFPPARPFLVQLFNENWELLDEALIMPHAGPIKAQLDIRDSSSRIQQPGLAFPVEVDVNIPGAYTLICRDAARQARSEATFTVLPSSPQETISCPVDKGEPGQWMVRLWRNLSDDHPDQQADQRPLAETTFDIIPAQHTVALSPAEVFDPDPDQPLVGVRYILTNTGNLPTRVQVSYKPITHALTATLWMSKTTWRTPYTATLTTFGQRVPLMTEDNLAIEPGDILEFAVQVRHDGELPEFALYFMPEQGDVTKRHERIEQIP